VHGSARAHHEYGCAGNEQSLALNQEPNPPQGGPQILRLGQVPVIQRALGAMTSGRRAGSCWDAHQACHGAYVHVHVLAVSSCAYLQVPPRLPAGPQVPGRDLSVWNRRRRAVCWHAVNADCRGRGRCNFKAVPAREAGLLLQPMPRCSLQAVQPGTEQRCQQYARAMPR
jgi:hypothetical protein